MLSISFSIPSFLKNRSSKLTYFLLGSGVTYLIAITLWHIKSKKNTAYIKSVQEKEVYFIKKAKQIKKTVANKKRYPEVLRAAINSVRQESIAQKEEIARLQREKD